MQNCTSEEFSEAHLFLGGRFLQVIRPVFIMGVGDALAHPRQKHP